MPTTTSGHTPTPALVLGAGGLIPFVGATALHVLTHDPRWLALLTSYGAVILSFVGALHWGYAVRDAPTGVHAWWRYGWSVVPALLAWLCLMLPASTAAPVLAAGLVACLVVDECLARGLGMPVWFLPLRRVLTAGGAASLMLGGLA